MILNFPLCLSCKHFRKTTKEHWFVCDAFPDGIPDDIFYGFFIHTKKYKGDNGIRYEEVDSNKNEIVKHWNEWSKFRKPVYEPHNEKSVSACEKYARAGILSPGCARALRIHESVYDKDKDDTDYVPADAISPAKLVSAKMNERIEEQSKAQAVGQLDKLFDIAYFFRSALGKVVITNWSSFSPDDKKALSSLFDDKGVLKDSKTKEFDKRFADYNTRRLKRGLPEKKL